MASTQEIIRLLLEENECEYEEAVVSLLNEFAIKYMRTIIQTSGEVASQQRRNSITIEDYKMALNIQSNTSVSELQMEQLARKRNTERFLEIDSSLPGNRKNTGIKLPAKDTNQLKNPNYQLVVVQPQQQKPQLKNNTIKMDQENERKKPVVPQRIQVEIPDQGFDF